MKTNKPIRLAVLGLDSGFFPENFVLWTQLCQTYPWIKPPFPKAEVVAAATLGCSEERILANLERSADDFARRAGVKLYQEAEELLDKEKPDGVFVCGRPSQMPAIALQAIRRGIHVYLQKPGGVDSATLTELAKEAKEREVAVAVGQTWRFDYGVATSREQLRTADVGKLCSLRVMFNHGMPGPKTFYFEESEGGPELWLGWYPIDLLHYFTGSQVVRLFATGHRGDGSGGRHNTILHASCEFANGVVGSLDFYGNISYAYSRAEWELLGEHGLVRNVQRHDIEVYQQGKTQQALYRNGFFDGVAQDINAWLHSWETQKTEGLTVQGAVEVLRVAEAMKKSLATGGAVSL